MKSKFGFYKTIILALASAITLIAVSFAWFSTSSTSTIGGGADTISYDIGGTTIYVEYYEDDGSGVYTPCTGNFDVSFDPAGGSKNYKMVVKNVSGGNINLTMSISELEGVDSSLLDNVYLDYYVVPVSDPTNKLTSTIEKKTTLDDYSFLSKFTTNGTLFTLQLNKSDLGTEFEVYYTISLKADNSLGAFSGTSIGKLDFSAVAVG